MFVNMLGCQQFVMLTKSSYWTKAALRKEVSMNNCQCCCCFKSYCCSFCCCCCCSCCLLFSSAAVTAITAAVTVTVTVCFFLLLLLVSHFFLLYFYSTQLLSDIFLYGEKLLFKNQIQLYFIIYINMEAFHYFIHL